MKQGRQYEYKSKTEVSSCNHCRCGKTISITNSECVLVALVL